MPRAPKRTPWQVAKAAERDARRVAIVEVATRCLNQRGYARSSMAWIASELGVSYNALYHYFRNKEALLVGCFEHGNRLLDDCVQRASVAPGNHLERVLAFALEFRSEVSRGRLPSPMLFVQLPKATIAAVWQSREARQAAVRNLLDAGVEDRSVRRGDTHLMVQFLFGCLENLPYFEYLDRPEELDQAIGQFFSGAFGAHARAP